MAFEQRPKIVRERVLLLSGRTTFQADGAASAKALRQTLSAYSMFKKQEGGLCFWRGRRKGDEVGEVVKDHGLNARSQLSL